MSFVAPAPRSDRSGHHILACVDRSAFSEMCLQHALSFARTLGSRLTLLHVMQPSAVQSGSQHDEVGWEIARHEALAYLAELQGAATRTLDARVDVRLEEGRPAERIVGVAREIAANLTVLGSHGDGGGSAWNLGSTAQQVLSVAPGSVFIARCPSGASVAAPRRILVPLDGSRRSESALQTATRLARTTDAEIVLVHVVQEPLASSVLRADNDLALARTLADHLELNAARYLEGIRDALARDGQAVRIEVMRHVNPRQCILEISQRELADVIAVSAHGAGCDAARTLGSVTSYLVAHSVVPLLILQDLSDAEPVAFESGVHLAPPRRATYQVEHA